MSISYMQSNFQEKLHINGQDPAQQVYKIWRKNFYELLRNHIFGVGSFFKAAPCTVSNISIKQFYPSTFFLPVAYIFTNIALCQL